MKSSELLITAIVEDLHNGNGTCSKKDVHRILRRTKTEGLSFLTKTLPSLDDSLVRGLSSGFLPDFLGWKRRGKTRLPEFLNDFWVKVFSSDGTILPAPDAYSIRCIRQITRSFKKIEEVCEDTFVDKAIQGFIDTDKTMALTTVPSYMPLLSEVCRALFSRALSPLTSGLSPLDCKHGPGSVADRLSSPEKWSFKELTPGVADEFGYEFFRSNFFDLLERPPLVEEKPARLIAVAKTALKPRLISIEPSDRQFVQQGLRALIEQDLNRIKICSYKDQTPNQKLAKIASESGDLATLDLSEASDRVHNGLVKSLFDWHPNFNRLSQACRSKMVQLPDGRKLNINKFASMGSSLTFPVEVMVFTTIVVYAICKVEGDFSRSFIKKVSKREDLRIYGDDIICHTRYVPTVVETLTELGLKVNLEKSFWEGKFRESCGSDWYDGVSVLPVYVRRELPTRRHHVKSIQALSAFRDLFLNTFGEGNVTLYIDSILEPMLGIYPYVSDPTLTSAICRRGDWTNERKRWNSNIQIVEIKAPVPIYRRKPCSHHEYGRLYKGLHSSAETTKVISHDPDYWTHDGRPISAILKDRWVELV